MNLNHPFEQAAAERAAQTAIYYHGGEISYSTFHDAVKRMAQGLQRMGISRGDRVAIMLPNIPQFPIAYFAVLRIGAVVVPLNTSLISREVAVLLEDCEARAIIHLKSSYEEFSQRFPRIGSLKSVILLGDDPLPTGTASMTRMMSRNNPLIEIADVDEDDPAIVEYTPGLTGIPKGVELTHGNILSNMNACKEVMHVTEKDVFLAILPMFYSMSRTLVLHLAISNGAAIDLYPQFDPDIALEAIKAERCTVMVGVPSVYRMILDKVGDEVFEIERPLRLCICGGDRFPEEVLKEFEKVFSTYILECYTTSETSPVVSFNQWRTGRRVGSLGHPIPGVEMRVVDERGNEASIGEVGEIVVKGYNVMRGYINRPRMTAEVLRDGWFHTSDMGKMDINGFFYLIDRMDDLIIKGGFSVYPSEIEEVLYCHPDVAEVAVIGIDDPVMGQEIKACIVLKEGAAVTTEELSDYCRQRMALYRVPALVRFYKDLPRTSNSQIDKKELRSC